MFQRRRAIVRESKIRRRTSTNIRSDDCLVETVSRNVITEKGNVEDFQIRRKKSVSFIHCHSFRNWVRRADNLTTFMCRLY
jgi:hypothetical protein